jgi:hypothetical protein
VRPVSQMWMCRWARPASRLLPITASAPPRLPFGVRIECPMTSPGTWVRRSPAGVWGASTGARYGAMPAWYLPTGILTRRPLRLFGWTLRPVHQVVDRRACRSWADRPVQNGSERLRTFRRRPPGRRDPCSPARHRTARGDPGVARRRGAQEPLLRPRGAIPSRTAPWEDPRRPERTGLGLLRRCTYDLLMGGYLWVVAIVLVLALIALGAVLVQRRRRSGGVLSVRPRPKRDRQ